MFFFKQQNINFGSPNFLGVFIFSLTALLVTLKYIIYVTLYNMYCYIVCS